MYNENEDGVTHINVHEFGKTQIGRDLSNSAFSAITHPQLGEFSSVEGALFYYLTEQKNEIFRNLIFQAPQKLAKNYIDLENINFKNHVVFIQELILLKLIRNSPLKQQLIYNELPLTTYKPKNAPIWFKNTNLKEHISIFNEIESYKNEINKKEWIFIEH